MIELLYLLEQYKDIIHYVESSCFVTYTRDNFKAVETKSYSINDFINKLSLKNQTIKKIYLLKIKDNIIFNVGGVDIVRSYIEIGNKIYKIKK